MRLPRTLTLRWTGGRIGAPASRLKDKRKIQIAPWMKHVNYCKRGKNRSVDILDPTMSMTEEARVLARELLRRHEAVRQDLGVDLPDDVTDGMIIGSVISYGVLCDRAGVSFLTHRVGHFLGEVADWCDENGWPPLNALAVNATTGIPGEGYDGASGCTLLNWPREVRTCVAFSGYPPSASL